MQTYWNTTPTGEESKSHHSEKVRCPILASEWVGSQGKRCETLKKAEAEVSGSRNVPVLEGKQFRAVLEPPVLGAKRLRCALTFASTWERAFRACISMCQYLRENFWLCPGGLVVHRGTVLVVSCCFLAGLLLISWGVLVVFWWSLGLLLSWWWSFGGFW